MFSLLQILQGEYLIEKDFRLKMLRQSYKFIGSDKVLPLPCAVAFGGQIARKLNAIRLNSEKGRQKTDFIETPDTNVELRGARGAGGRDRLTTLCEDSYQSRGHYQKFGSASNCRLNLIEVSKFDLDLTSNDTAVSSKEGKGGGSSSSHPRNRVTRLDALHRDARSASRMCHRVRIGG